MLKNGAGVSDRKPVAGWQDMRLATAGKAQEIIGKSALTPAQKSILIKEFFDDDAFTEIDVNERIKEMMGWNNEAH